MHVDRIRIQHSSNVSVIIMNVDRIRIQHSSNVSVIIMNVDHIRIQHSSNVSVIIMHVDRIRIQRSSNVSVIIMNLAAGGRPHCPRLLLAAQPLELRQVAVPVAEGRQGSSAVWHRHAHGHQDGARSGHGAWQN